MFLKVNFITNKLHASKPDLKTFDHLVTQLWKTQKSTLNSDPISVRVSVTEVLK